MKYQKGQKLQCKPDSPALQEWASELEIDCWYHDDYVPYLAGKITTVRAVNGEYDIDIDRLRDDDRVWNIDHEEYFFMFQSAYELPEELFEL